MIEKWKSISGMPDTECKSFACVADGVQLIKDIAKSNPTQQVNVLVTGSLYLVGAVLQVCEVEV